jgi:pimeloyl-ACP methyl ester carboxylesterase
MANQLRKYIKRLLLLASLVRLQIFTRLGVFFIFALALTACGITNTPNLKRLYSQSNNVEQPPVILIHGVMGSRLQHNLTKTEAWPGNFIKIISSDYQDLALQIDPNTLLPISDDLEAVDVTRTVLGIDYYEEIIITLIESGRYKLAKLGEPQTIGNRNLYIFYYDWRQDNVFNSKKLKSFISQIRKDYAAPQLKFDIVAHSMGGLLTRYFLRYGDIDVLDDNNFPVNLQGSKMIRRSILLGTPNLGSITSLHAFMEGATVGMKKIPPETLATFPSLYQLFPHALNNWIMTMDGHPLQRDLFDIDIWRRFQWSIFNPDIRQRILKNNPTVQLGEEQLTLLEKYFAKHLERARRFVWSLTVPLPSDDYELIIFGGNCHLTPARLLVEEFDGESKVHLFPKSIINPLPSINYEQLMLEPGDGTVTKASLLAREALDPSVPRHKFSHFPIDYSLFLCERHDRLPGNHSFQDNLLHALLNLDQ